jgi:hypothetical protein
MTQEQTPVNDLFAPIAEAERLKGNEMMLTEALGGNSGNRGWREWKTTAAKEVFDLFGRTNRVRVLAFGLDGDLNMNYAVQMPVPRWPTGDQLVIDRLAVFHLHYQEQWRWESPPGWAPLGLWHPRDPFHPNMQPALRGAICLGKLPPGVPPREIVLLGYFALSLQDRVLDESDPNGVLNPLACDYFRRHPEYLPLTRAGLLDAWEGGA